MLRCMDPVIPASLHSLPQKYNIPYRLWETGFEKLLQHYMRALPRPLSSQRCLNVPPTTCSIESLPDRDATVSILDHMTDFIYYAYTLYSHLMEDHSLLSFQSSWMEQLGDLARYKMAVAKMMLSMAGTQHPLSNDQSRSSDNTTPRPPPKAASPSATAQPVTSKRDHSKKAKKGGIINRRPVRDDDLEDAQTPGDSIGNVALDKWEISETDIWKTIAKDWYSRGLIETPGTGRLHHHLALLAMRNDPDLPDRDARLIDLRCIYHISKR